MQRLRRMMLRNLPLALLPGAAFPAAAAAEAKGTDANAAISHIRRDGMLKVAVPKVRAAPFFTLSDAPSSGVDIAIAEALARSLHGPLQIDRRAGSFNEVIDQVAAGGVHLALCKLSRTLPRAQRVFYTKPYAVQQHALFINRLGFAALSRGKKPEDTLRNFEGDLGILANSSYHDIALRDFPRATLHEYADWESVFHAVRKGELHAGYSDHYTINRLFSADRGLSLTARMITLNDKIDRIAVAVPHAAFHFAAYIDLFMELSHGAQALPAGELVKTYGIQDA